MKAQTGDVLILPDGWDERGRKHTRKAMLEMYFPVKKPDMGEVGWWKVRYYDDGSNGMVTENAIETLYHAS